MEVTEKMLRQARELAALKEPASNYAPVRSRAQQQEIDDARQAALEWADLLNRNRDADSDFG